MSEPPPPGPPQARAATPPDDGVRIVPASTLGDPRALEGLARTIFGAGDRPAGWFARKLRREHVDPRLSPVAVRGPGDARDDPATWLGYVLVGTPPSLHPAVRTAGTGVHPDARGRGLGGRLLAAARAWSKAAGYRRLQLLADAAVLPFYARQGLDLVTPTVTLLAFAPPGDGAIPVVPPAPTTDWPAPADDAHEVIAWLPETWRGTEAAARHRLAWPDAAGPCAAWLSREGVAWLVQRLVIPRATPIPEAVRCLLARLPPAAPVLLPLLPADDPATRALRSVGWTVAQRGALLQCPL